MSNLAGRSGRYPPPRAGTGGRGGDGAGDWRDYFAHLRGGRTYTLTATDSTSGMQTSGHTGLAGLVSSTTTNVPVTLRIDDLSVVRPG